MYYSSQMYTTQWDSHIGISSAGKIGGAEQLISFEPNIKSPSNIVTPLQTLPAFSATKSRMSFQQHEHQTGLPSLCSEFPKAIDSPIRFPQSSGDNFTDAAKQEDRSTSQFTNSLQSDVESFLSSSVDSFSFSENCSKLPSYTENMPLYEHFEHSKLLGDDAVAYERPLPISLQRNQLLQVDKQSSEPCGVACATSRNSVSRRAPTGKRRIRWTKELHEPFIMIVNSLGGPAKAKPKAILDMMGSDMLTISHVKSHLQKYRSTRYMQKPLQEKSVEGHKTDEVNELQVKLHMQIEESRQLQVEVSRSLHEQLEMQRNLQQLIEQQRKQLKKMLDHQKQQGKPEEIPVSEIEESVPD